MVSTTREWSDAFVSRLQSIVICVLLAAIMALAGYTHPLFVGVVVILLQAMIAAAPAPADERGRSISSPRFVPVILAGVVTTILTLWPQLLNGAHGTTSVGRISNGVVAGIMPGIAVGVIAALIAQMFRRDGRSHLVLSVGYTVTLCVLVTLPVGWIGAAQSAGRAIVVLLGALGVAIAMGVWAIPRDRVIVGAASVAAAAGGGAGVAVLLPSLADVGPAYGAVSSAGAAFFAITGIVVGRSWCQGRLRVETGWGFPAAMALTLSAPVVFIAGQLATVHLTGTLVY